MINDSEYRISWSNFPTGVSVLATRDNNKNLVGMTANSLMSISLEPKIIMISVGNNRSILEYLGIKDNVSISILTKGQSNIADYFSNSNQSLKENYFLEKNEIYYIEDCLCYFFCKIINFYVVGDHTVFSLLVEKMNIGENRSPLIWYQGNFSNKIL